MNKIIVLCGSTRFKNTFKRIEKYLTLKGNVVLSPVIFSHYDNIILSEDEKNILSNVHKKKN